jgi:hypothetical protein
VAACGAGARLSAAGPQDRLLNLDEALQDSVAQISIGADAICRLI